ncbi:MAG: hypothetical protein A3K19_16165 [Lentisphaerae bacterium RIFOXYB12_FULL_65_16]|nr:MAG: hypothetical protein A3K18_24750 [Lentisphaerae bacterium RIFOXYA12_64_32]OGV92567.1 MAG: hypothetical protein A3K19_16165 [Lentisphaerae bacterium RIFOXYB12_FULL_65_16]
MPNPKDAIGFLIRSQHFFLVLLCVFVLALAATFGIAFFQTCRDVVTARRGAGAVITLPAALDEQPRPPDSREPLPADESEDAEAAAVAAPQSAAPECDWRDVARLRKAAALLVRHNEVEAAIHLLNQGGASDGALDIAVAVHRQAQEALDRVIATELGQVRSFWGGLAEDQRQSYFPANEPAARQAFEQRLATTDTGGGLETLGACVPESVLLCLVANAQAEMKGLGNCPEELIRLLLEPLFQPSSLARRLWCTLTSGVRFDYDENRKLFDRQLNSELLTALVRGQLAEVKSRYEAAAPDVRRWCESVQGAAFCQRLERCPVPDADEVQMRLVWLELPLRFRALWGRELARALTDCEKVTLPSYTLAENYWLKEASAALDAEVLHAVCSHPEWRRALQSFAYDEALRALPGVLRLLGGEGDQPAIVRVLTRSVLRERQQLAGPDMDWPQLRAHLNVEETRPEALRSVRRKPSATDVGSGLGRVWADVPKEDFHAGLLHLAAVSTTAPPKQAYYRRLARLYALNRGLEE